MTNSRTARLRDPACRDTDVVQSGTGRLSRCCPCLMRSRMYSRERGQDPQVLLMEHIEQSFWYPVIGIPHVFTYPARHRKGKPCVEVPYQKHLIAAFLLTNELLERPPPVLSLVVLRRRSMNHHSQTLQAGGADLYTQYSRIPMRNSEVSSIKAVFSSSLPRSKRPLYAKLALRVSARAEADETTGQHTLSPDRSGLLNTHNVCTFVTKLLPQELYASRKVGTFPFRPMGFVWTFRLKTRKGDQCLGFLCPSPS